MTKIPVILLLFLLFYQGIGQTQVTTTVCSSEIISPENYNNKLFEQLLLSAINQWSSENGKDTFRLKKHLNLAAGDQARYMAKYRKVTANQVHYDREQTAVRVEHYGGSMIAREIVTKINIKQTGAFISYEQACQNLTASLYAKRKNSDLLLNNQYNLIGIGAYPDYNFKRIYVSIVLGNFKSDNSGAKMKLTVPYTDKYFGLTAPFKKDCRKVNRSQNIFEFQQQLSIANNRIYIKSDNAKELYRFLRNPKDGLSVDILQKDQFNPHKTNVVNYNNINRGVLLKPTFSHKIRRKNKADTKNNRYALDVKIGKIPRKLNDSIELNLVLIQNKSICTFIPQNFLVAPHGKYNRQVNYIANIEKPGSTSKYFPIPDSTTLTLKIPFEKNRYTFKNKDIEPFIKALNEPDFSIYAINLIAYSSIEGSQRKNLQLQKQREESILKALKDRQADPIKTSSASDFNWTDFVNEISNTEFAYLAELSMAEAQAEINDKNLYPKLEPILKNQRYAKVNLHVRYNISGDKEAPYVLSRFYKALHNADYNQALDIQKYMINQVMQYKYPDSIISNLKIPMQANCASLLLNKFYLGQLSGKISDSAFIKNIVKLQQINPEDPFVLYNALLATLNHSSIDYLYHKKDSLQAKIESLYSGSISEPLLDALNIRYQMKIIAASEQHFINQKLYKRSFDILKNVVDIQSESLLNAKKLAVVFMENNEYQLAKETLEQWVDKNNDLELLLTYISLCSPNEWDMHTQKFNTAMQKLSEIDATEFCSLFYRDKLSYLVFENQRIKNLYCETCLHKQSNDPQKTVKK